LIKSLKIDLAKLKNQYEVPGSEERAEDFEGGSYKNNLARLNWKLINSVGSTYGVVNNPELNTVNPSLKTGELTRSEANGSTQIQVHLGDQYWDLTTTRYITLKLRADVNTNLQVKLSRDGVDAFDVSANIRGDAEWHELELDFTKIPYAQLQNTFNQLDFVFTSTNSDETGVVWFDEIKFSDNVSTALHRIPFNKTIIYPNPSDDLVWFKSEHAINRVEVFSMEGALMLVQGGKDMQSLSLQSLSTGHYLLRLSNAKAQFVSQIIKI